jgi:hypothetical protein
LDLLGVVIGDAGSDRGIVIGKLILNRNLVGLKGLSLLLSSLKEVAIFHWLLSLRSVWHLLLLQLLEILLHTAVLLLGVLVLLFHRSVHCHLLSLVLLSLILLELEKLSLLLGWLLLGLVLLELELVLLILVHQLLHHLVVLCWDLVVGWVRHLESCGLLLHGLSLHKSLVVVRDRALNLLLLSLLLVELIVLIKISCIQSIFVQVGLNFVLM